MKLEILEKDHYYHIFNRGINSDIIFQNEDNMFYFLKLIEKHLNNKVDNDSNATITFEEKIKN